MRMRFLLCGVATLGLVTWTTVCTAQTGDLRAGAAKVDISPTKDMFPIKAMQVYGSLHDPLFVRALVLDNGVAKAAFISVDAADVIYGSELIQAVTGELKIPAENLIINATHDHNSPLFGSPGREPATGRPYFELVKKGILEAARQANASLQPARIGFGTGKAYVNTNRDQKIGEGYHMGYAPEGPSDKTVAVVLLTKPSGEPIAIYTNYAVHSVVMFRTHTQDGQVQVTSDLAGWTARYVEDHFAGAVALFTMGAAGDQNPLFMANYNQDAPDVYDEGPAGWAILDVQSRRLGEEIVRVVKAVQNTAGRAVIWAAGSSVTCPGQQRETPPQPGAPQAGWRAPAPSTVKMIDGDPVKIPASAADDQRHRDHGGCRRGLQRDRHAREAGLAVRPHPDGDAAGEPGRLHPHGQGLPAAIGEGGRQPPQARLRRAGDGQRVPGHDEALPVGPAGGALDPGRRGTSSQRRHQRPWSGDLHEADTE